MSFFYLKALHFIFVVTWFSGLFYIVRLYVYHAEALEKSDPEKSILVNQFSIMEKRLWYGITWPSAILTILFGLSLAHNFLPLSENSWLVSKLFLVLGLFIYHLYCGKIRKDLNSGKGRYSSFKLRILNEVSTLFLISIVFLVVLKSHLSMLWGLLGLILFSIVLMMAIRIYKKIRES
ncbi:MAG: CopD family protein [Bdellovibrionales bacterium]|nr:CopD family protein [Bdellovibrionales bacterium]